MKFSKPYHWYVLLISYKFQGDWPHRNKTIGRKVSVIVFAYQLFYACKRNGRLFRYKIALDALIQIAYILVDF